MYRQKVIIANIDNDTCESTTLWTHQLFTSMYHIVGIRKAINRSMVFDALYYRRTGALRVSYGVSLPVRCLTL